MQGTAIHTQILYSVKFITIENEGANVGRCDIGVVFCVRVRYMLNSLAVFPTDGNVGMMIFAAGD